MCIKCTRIIYYLAGVGAALGIEGATDRRNRRNRKGLHPNDFLGSLLQKYGCGDALRVSGAHLNLHQIAQIALMMWFRPEVRPPNAALPEVHYYDGDIAEEGQEGIEGGVHIGLVVEAVQLEGLETTNLMTTVGPGTEY